MEDIGREIKKLVKKEKASLYRIAKDLGVAYESLFRSLSDGANPEWKRIRQLLDYLGYDVKFINRKEGKKIKPKPLRTRKKRK
jgi:DNA-binding phage protein